MRLCTRGRLAFYQWCRWQEVQRDHVETRGGELMRTFLKKIKAYLMWGAFFALLGAALVIAAMIFASRGVQSSRETLLSWLDSVRAFVSTSADDTPIEPEATENVQKITAEGTLTGAEQIAELLLPKVERYVTESVLVENCATEAVQDPQFDFEYLLHSTNKKPAFQDLIDNPSLVTTDLQIFPSKKTTNALTE